MCYMKLFKTFTPCDCKEEDAAECWFEFLTKVMDMSPEDAKKAIEEGAKKMEGKKGEKEAKILKKKKKAMKKKAMKGMKKKAMKKVKKGKRGKKGKKDRKTLAEVCGCEER